MCVLGIFIAHSIARGLKIAAFDSARCTNSPGHKTGFTAD